MFLSLDDYRGNLLTDLFEKLIKDMEGVMVPEKKKILFPIRMDEYNEYLTEQFEEEGKTLVMTANNNSSLRLCAGLTIDREYYAGKKVKEIKTYLASAVTPDKNVITITLKEFLTLLFNFDAEKVTNAAITLQEEEVDPNLSIYLVPDDYPITIFTCD